MRRAGAWALAATCLLQITGCTRSRSPVAPTRGVILISIDTLRADRLSLYGAERETSPFLDELGARGVVFEHAVSQYPSTLTSHMTLFTGLYPAEHGVYPPDRVLAEEIATLPQLFEAAGFATAGFTEGGFVRGRFGFGRGFRVFRDDVARTPRDLEETLRRGIDWLRERDGTERFFLFLHTYAVHAPYLPPAPFDRLFWQGEPPPFEPTTANLQHFNTYGGALPARTREFLMAQYDGEIAYADAQLRSFFGELENLGLAAETTVVVLSDHGEEFLEHGRFAHSQIYPETLDVPLLVVSPSLPGPRRVERLVQLLDVAPTLCELAGVPAAPGFSGRSLVPELLGSGAAPVEEEGYSEVENGISRSLQAKVDGVLYQLLLTRTSPRRWLGREVVFDLGPGATGFTLRSFVEPRTVEVWVEDSLLERLVVGTDWQEVIIPLEKGVKRRRVRVASPTCTRVEHGASERCWSFQIQAPPPQRLELFELDRDPFAQVDLSRERSEVVRRLATRLRAYERSAVARPQVEELEADLEDRLRALGYLQ